MHLDSKFWSCDDERTFDLRSVRGSGSLSKAIDLIRIGTDERPTALPFKIRIYEKAAESKVKNYTVAV